MEVSIKTVSKDLKTTPTYFLVHLEGALHIPENKRRTLTFYSITTSEKICLLIGVRSLPLLRSRCKSTSPKATYRPKIPPTLKE